jgi:hypothetical protein
MNGLVGCNRDATDNSLKTCVFMHRIIANSSRIYELLVKEDYAASRRRGEMQLLEQSAIVSVLRRGDPCERPRGICDVQGEDELRPYQEQRYSRIKTARGCYAFLYCLKFFEEIPITYRLWFC